MLWGNDQQEMSLWAVFQLRTAKLEVFLSSPKEIFQ
jgi:hypothetical protein